jgi:hypothetical protein
MTSYIDYRTEPINETEHPTFIIHTTVECDSIFCSYRETFDSVEDAEIGAEVHESYGS